MNYLWTQELMQQLEIIRPTLHAIISELIEILKIQ